MFTVLSMSFNPQPVNRDKVPYLLSFGPYETPSKSASHSDPSFLTLGQHFYQRFVKLQDSHRRELMVGKMVNYLWKYFDYVWFHLQYWHVRTCITHICSCYNARKLYTYSKHVKWLRKRGISLITPEISEYVKDSFHITGVTRTYMFTINILG